MSYEGYEQLICPNGHVWTVDHSLFSFRDIRNVEREVVCSHCGQIAISMCSVDITNGYDSKHKETFQGPLTRVNDKNFEVGIYKIDNSTGRWKSTKPYFQSFHLFERAIPSQKTNQSKVKTSEYVTPGGFIKKDNFPNLEIVGKVYPLFKQPGVSIKIIGGILNNSYAAEILNNDPKTKGMLFIGYIVDDLYFKLS